MDQILKSLEELIDEKISQLDSKDSEINNLSTKLEANRNKQQEEFFTLAKKIEPMIKYFQEKGYFFKHDNIKYVSTLGPIVGYKESNLYVYIRGNLITKVNVNTNSQTDIFFQEFMKEISFKEAIIGLQNVLKLQDTILRDYTQEIEETEEELKSINQYV